MIDGGIQQHLYAIAIETYNIGEVFKSLDLQGLELELFNRFNRLSNLLYDLGDYLDKSLNCPDLDLR